MDVGGMILPTPDRVVGVVARVSLSNLHAPNNGLISSARLPQKDAGPRPSLTTE